MLVVPNSEAVENSMDYFYGPVKTQKNRVLLLRLIEENQFRDVIAEKYSSDSVPIIVVKGNKISELESIRQKLLQLPKGTCVLLSMRLDSRFVQGSQPGKIWHGYHQSNYVEIADPQPIIDIYDRRQLTERSFEAKELPLNPAELKEVRLRLVDNHQDLHRILAEQSKVINHQNEQINKLQTLLAQQEVRAQTNYMEFRGDILQLRLEIGRLKGKKRRKTGSTLENE